MKTGRIESGMVTTLRGDSRQTLPTLAPKSVHMAVTSPPYWALRSYLKAGHPDKHLEIGSEKTPAEYIQNLMAVFDPLREALRDDGVLFVNLGDSYSSTPKGNLNGQDKSTLTSTRTQENAPAGMDKTQSGIDPLNLVGIPHLFAFAMREGGWLWRDTVIWSKTCAMPSSVDGWRWERHRVKSASGGRCKDPSKNGSNGQKPHGAREGKEFVSEAEWVDCPGCEKCSDTGGLILRKGSWRTTTAHEYIFMFAKTDSYFCDAYAVRTPAKDATIGRNNYSRVVDDKDEQFAVAHDHEFTGATANLRSVWEIGPEPLSGESHYAAYPSELPRKCIMAGTSAKGCCAKCGAPWARVVKKTRSTRAVNSDFAKLQEHGNLSTNRSDEIVDESLGWRPTCNCNAGNPIPCTVLDPFGGSGRTALAAIALGRRAILCELNDDYVEIQRRQFGKHMPLFT